MENGISLIISFAFYLVFMLLIGWYFYKRTQNLSDYILGGRGLNSWVTSMSAQASDMSGWLLLGLPGYAYLSGYESVWIAIGLVVGTYCNWKFIARKLRVYTEVAGDSITLPDYFENRFKDKSRILRIVSAIFIIIFFLIYTASGFVAGAKLFNSVFGLSYEWALLVGVLVIISYTFLGGFMAVSWTDFFQGIIMFFAISIVPIVAMNLVGGLDVAHGAMEELNPQLLDMFTNAQGESLTTIAILSLLGWGMGYYGQPHILARFMAINSPNGIPKARAIAMVWVVISLIASVMVGIIGISYLSDAPLSAVDSETVFIVLVQSVSHPLLAGILLSAILAAIMSTADSQLLVTSSALTEDLYRTFKKEKVSDKHLVWVGRLTVIAVSIVAFIIALKPNSSVLDLVGYAWAGFGAAFGPLVILSLYWKRMTFKGALAGMLVGGLTVLIWKQLSGGIFELYEIVPGIILSAIAIVVVSKIDAEPSQEIVSEYQTVSDQLHED